MLAPAPAAILFENVTYTPPGGANTVLRDCSFAVQPGELFVLLGESGAGKSTALKLINGLYKPQGGKVVVDGKATTEWDAIELRRRVGYVLQDDGLFPHYSVGRNVSIVPELLNWERERVQSRVREMLELVHLSPAEYENRFPAQLSGGQRQRVGLARALAADPPLLLFDESFGRLDPITREHLRGECRDLCRRLSKTAVLVTHDLREALLFGDRVALLKNGRLLFVGTPHEFLKSGEPDVRAYCQTLEIELPGLGMARSVPAGAA